MVCAGDPTLVHDAVHQVLQPPNLALLGADHVLELLETLGGFDLAPAGSALQLTNPPGRHNRSTPPGD